MHAKDSQHDCRTRRGRRGRRRARVIAIFQFCFFFLFPSFFCSLGVHTQRFVGPTGAFIRATTFVSGVNFRSQSLSRESRERGVFSCRRRENQLEINPREQYERKIKLPLVTCKPRRCSIDGRVIPRYIVRSV